MHYQPRVAFVPDGPFVVATRNFVYAGRHYQRGEDFDVAGIDRFEQFALWNALLLDVKPTLTPARPGTLVSHGNEVTIQMPGVVSKPLAEQIERRPKFKHRR